MVAFSDVADNGTVPWMATSDAREGDADEGGGHVRSIKIWEWRHGTYILNTHFAKAHGASAVTSMVFREPTVAAGTSTAKKPEMLLLTTAEDGSAKMWTIKRGVADTMQSGPGESRLPFSSHRKRHSMMIQISQTLIFSLNPFEGVWTNDSAILSD
jgi:hypothetical protein